MTSVIPRVQPGSFLTLHYRLGGPAGDIINTFDGKPATLSLGTGELSPAMEECLIGMEEGARTTFELPAGAAFGPRNPDMQQWLARKVLTDMGDPPSAMWWSSPRPTAKASLPAWCSRSRRPRCCLTSTTRWPASPSALKCN